MENSTIECLGYKSTCYNKQPDLFSTDQCRFFAVVQELVLIRGGVMDAVDNISSLKSCSHVYNLILLLILEAFVLIG